MYQLKRSGVLVLCLAVCWLAACSTDSPTETTDSSVDKKLYLDGGGGGGGGGSIPDDDQPIQAYLDLVEQALAVQEWVNLEFTVLRSGGSWDLLPKWYPEDRFVRVWIPENGEFAMDGLPEEWTFTVQVPTYLSGPPDNQFLYDLTLYRILDVPPGDFDVHIEIPPAPWYTDEWAVGEFHSYQITGGGEELYADNIQYHYLELIPDGVKRADVILDVSDKDDVRDGVTGKGRPGELD